MCCTWLAENTGCKNDAKNRHLGTIPQLCQAICSQLRHVSAIGKKLVKQQYLLHMSSQYGELRPTNGWDRFGSLGHPSYFQRLLRLGSVTARQSSSECQPNFAALNRGRHLCSAGRPSRWALAHISSLHCVCTQMRENPAKESNLAAFTETMFNILSLSFWKIILVTRVTNSTVDRMATEDIQHTAYHFWQKNETSRLTGKLRHRCSYETGRRLAGQQAHQIKGEMYM